MTKYDNGVAFERKIRKEFEAAHFFVIRAAGSHGLADLVAIRPNWECQDCMNNTPNNKKRFACTTLIQCKLSDDGKMTREKADLLTLAEHNGCHAEWISRNRGVEKLR